MPQNNLQKDKRPQPLLVVFFGMTASGKSTLAMAWSKQHRMPYYNTDRVRKELAGLQVTDRRPDGIEQGIYSPALSALTYQAMLDKAAEDIAGGARVVVLDGSYGQRADRDAVRRVAAPLGADCLFVYCFCSETETKRRLAIRAVDSEAVSDGRWEIYVHQKTCFAIPDGDECKDCLLLNTEATLPQLLQKITAQSHRGD